MRPIGLFDSGLGGLTVLRALMRRFPQEHFVYLGDTARAPYGSKGEATIRRYAHECAQFLLARDIKLMVVACNTASAVALRDLEGKCACPVIGTIDSAMSALSSANSPKRIGVIGTPATVASGAYQAAITRRFPNAEIITKACPLFVPLVENGLFEGEIVEKVIELYCGELRSAHIDALVLGCTHYPILRDSLSRYFGHSVHFIDCGEAIASQIEAMGLGNSAAAGSVSLFVTDDSGKFSALSRLILDAGKIEATTVQLGESA